MSPHEAGLALASLEKRASCQAILGTVYATVSSAALVVFVDGATGFAKRICKLEGSEKCEEYADLIADGFNLIWLAGAAYKHGASAVSTAQEVINSAAGGSTSFENVTLPARWLKARDGEPALVNRVVLRNVTSSEKSRAHDVVIHHYDDGTGQLHLPLYGQSLGGSSGASDVHKRFDGAGFKIAFTSRPTPTPSRSNETALSSALAQNWWREAHANINELIGFVKASNKANCYWRIIPEIQGFGLNYEGEDVCGGRAAYLDY